MEKATSLGRGIGGINPFSSAKNMGLVKERLSKWFVFLFDTPPRLSVAWVFRVPIQACACVHLSAEAMHVNALLGSVVMSLA